MPLYDYRCTACASEFDEIKRIDERAVSTCPSCGGKGKLFIKPGKAPGVSVFRSGWYEHIGPKPIHINNPQELRDACDRHNGYSHYLENSVFKTSPGPDPIGIRGTGTDAKVPDDY